MNLDIFCRKNKFLMLALDHQENFRKLVNNDQQIIDLKRQILQALEPQYSSVLIDCEFGLPAYSGIHKPYLLRLEKSLPPDKNGARKTEISHSVEDLKGQGASGIKLLVFVDPTSEESLTMNKKIILSVLADCKRWQLPLFLEIITYEQSNQRKKGELILSTLDFFLKNEIIPAVFKLEYPENAGFCQKITDCLSTTPWILLSGGADFYAFKEQLIQAVSHGASGFLAGRAVWQDIINYQDEKRNHYLQEILPDRFSQLNKIALT